MGTRAAAMSVPWLAVTFLVIYCALLLFIVANACAAAHQRHKLWSFATGFSLCCFAWTALRVVFWVRACTVRGRTGRAPPRLLRAFGGGLARTTELARPRRRGIGALRA